MRRRNSKWLDGIFRHTKIIFPVIIIALVAVTVVAAMKLSDAKQDKVEQFEQTVPTAESIQEPALENVDEPVLLELNEDPAINSLVTRYYNALALGDLETVQALSDESDDKELILIREKAKYIDFYPIIEVYSKPGYDEDSLVLYVYTNTVFKNIETGYPGYRTMYVSTRDDGTLYFKNYFSDEESAYITRVSEQDDVVDLNNRVIVEFNDIMESNPKLLDYLNELTVQIEKDAGAELGKLHADAEPDESQEPEQPSEEEPPVEEEEPPQEEIILYVKTTATVNVRSSDSEKADKLGKAAKGMKLQVLEQRVNGWTKVLYEGKDGYIKSEYLVLQDTTAGLSPIGTVEATANVNVRSQASQTADKLGALPKGTKADLYARENGWCKIDFNGQIGYVKEDFVK